ncbi:MFS transporter [Intrasporangium calvum]|uniref:Major facilitator superfamily MFS_1 n=1 Tax=Intrasporangium calvum (strain ATCC 23552 / DSM 43043 / JCM 3097 / NBRC 12989 / NCIMB 10167 / NRRL B-3866 / 7 KIP) TaxID=710696 RepID=E6S866_INTC7|nr:MFS transporter [Intrasporangium calvum]ADU46970.1 major facilitator superfamily MFS_1 [Intrasporangium calvum DSM 43043]
MSTHSTARPTLSSFWQDLPRDGKLLISTVVFQSIGTGLVLPFMVVYLNEVRGIALETVGLLLALQAGVGIAVVTPVGALIDRVGPRRVYASSLVALILADILLARATTVNQASVALLLLGYGFGVVWPASSALIGNLIPSELRQRYFGVNFTLLNLGIGIGGIIGGRFVDVTRPDTFVAVYLLDALSYIPGLVILLGPLRHARDRVERAADAASVRVSYRALLRDPDLRALLSLVAVAALVSYPQLNAGLPAYARAEGQISTQGLGYAFAVNTLVIVLLQLFVLQRIEGKRRTRVAVVMAGTWAVAWSLLGATSIVPGTIVATVLLAACTGIFGLGETMLQPTTAAMVNDLAPDHLRGRYNALSSLMFSIAFVVGPVIASFLIGHDLGGGYIAFLVGGCALLVIMALAAERRLPAHVNGLRPAPGGSVTAPAPISG